MELSRPNSERLVRWLARPTERCTLKLAPAKEAARPKAATDCRFSYDAAVRTIGTVAQASALDAEGMLNLMSGFGVRRPCETFRPWARWPQAFAPPYDRPERLEAPGPPLGSVVVLELSQLCSDDWARVPVWCPVVVVADLGVTRLFSLQLLTEARREVALVEPFARPGAILKAVRTRPAPPVGALLDWLRRRPVPAPMLRALDPLIERAPERTVRHRFGRLGGWRSHDWSRILDLARAKGGNRQGQTALAEVLAIDRRTLSAWTHRYLGLRARQYDAYAGWEWVLEAALRQESGRLTGAGR